ncbi:hypothetical protein FNI11_06475 [Salmonella enterica subsp. salamae]|nr:hypothetical protein [Salmonella enterica subsp. salamae]ECJ2280556.1 hypothetical protein [Salmonella enterica subsp. salamae]
MSLKVTDTGSLSVNQYGWINIWTAILGHFFAQFPAFFEGRRIAGQNQAENVSDNADIMRIYALLFFCVLGIKRDARLIQSTRCLFRVATSSRVKTFALACGFVLRGGRGGDSR